MSVSIRYRAYSWYVSWNSSELPLNLKPTADTVLRCFNTDWPLRQPCPAFTQCEPWHSRHITWGKQLISVDWWVMMCLSDLLITDDYDPLVATLSRGHRPQEQLRQVIGHWVPEGWTRGCLCYHHSVQAWDNYSSQVQIQWPHYSLHQGEKWPSW